MYDGTSRGCGSWLSHGTARSSQGAFLVLGNHEDLPIPPSTSIAVELAGWRVLNKEKVTVDGYRLRRHYRD